MVEKLVLGVDSLPYEKANRLNLTNIQKIGKIHRLKSTISPSSGPAWSSFQTGLKPKNHGIYGFLDSYDTPMNTKDVHGKRIWEYFDDPIIVNLPLTYPPSEGVMVSSLVSPVRTVPTSEEYKKVSHPDQIGEILESYGYVVSAGENTDELEDYIDVMDKRVSLFLYLVENYESDLAFLMIDCFDRLTHNIELADEDTLNALLFEIDKQIGKILRRVDAEEVILLSDHGTQKIGAEFYINQYFKEKGWLVFKEGNRGEIVPDKRRSKCFFYFEDHTTYGKIRLTDLEVRKRVIKGLESIKFIDEIYEKEEMYGEDPKGSPPDLMVKFEDTIPRKGTGNLLEERYTYQHSKNGVLVTDKELKKANPSIIDVLPSIVGEKGGMDGDPLW